MKQIIQLSLIFFLFTNCSRSTFHSAYLSPAFEQSRIEDKILAILPFDVVNHYKRIPKGETIETLKLTEEMDAYMMQRDLYRYCLRVMSKDRYTVDFQHVNETNRILIEKGIDYRQIKKINRKELAEILGVDAVVSGEVHQLRNRWNPFMIRGLFKSTRCKGKKVDARIAIHNREQKRPVWKYKDGVSFATEDSVLSLSRRLLRTVADRIPYQKDSATARR